MTTARLGWMLLRAGGRTSVSVLAMAVVCSAVSTGLLLFVVGGYDALTGRATSTAWRSPVEVGTGSATAVLGSAVQSVDGRALTVVDLAVLPDERLDPPPGLPRVPAPGEVWVSPALDALARDLPDDRLADRLYPPDGDLARAGVIDPDTLVSPVELLAVVGRDPADPLMATGASHLAGGPDVTAPRLVQGLPGAPGEVGSGRLAGDAELYRGLALCAIALLVVPLTTLAAAAARLGVSRRDQRLAAMRLVGASSRQVTVLTALEAGAAALVGVVLGTALHAAVLAPIGTQISLQQNTFAWGQLWPAGWHLPAAWGFVVVIGVCGAVLGLRRVRISPLGVTARVTPPGVKVVRLVVLVLAFVVWSAVGAQAFGAGLVVVAGGVLVLLGTVSLVGPWVVWGLGHLVVRAGRGTATMLAGRRLVDDPKGAWRTVGGLALVGFVAAGLSVFPALGTALDGQERSTVRVELPAGVDGAEAAAVVDRRLAAAGLPAAVTVEDRGADGEARAGVVVRVADGEASADQLDVAATALTGVVPGAPVRSSADAAAVDGRIMDDIATGSIITLAVVFVVAAVSAGLGQASTVLDTRRQLQLLTLAGTPGRVLRSARRRQVLVPLLGTLSTSVGLGLVFLVPLGGAELVREPQGLLMLGVCLVAGVTAVLLAVEASTPLLGRVSRRLPEAVG